MTLAPVAAKVNALGDYLRARREQQSMS